MFGQSGRRSPYLRVLVLVLLLVATAQFAWQVKGQQSAPGGPSPMGNSAVAGQASGVADSSVAHDANGPVVTGQSYKNDVSPALRDIKPIPPDAQPRKNGAADDKGELIPLSGHNDMPDAVVQRQFGSEQNGPSPLMPSPLANFAGISSTGGCNGCAPPDTNGDVGPNNFVQSVNSAFQVWNKSGTSLYGPANINTLWSGFGGPCQTNNDGDPIVLYDPIGNRWLISQFTASSPYNECIAISSTADPTGSYNRYAFQLSTSDFPDYPKLGVWPDGYYMSVNWFTGGQTYAGPRPYVFNRAQMIAGAAASFQTTSGPLGSSKSPILPADLDGPTLPASGAPNYFVGFGSPMPVYKFHVDWSTPSNTTFTNSANLTPAAFTQLCTTTQNCVPQKGTTQKLDGLADRLMQRLAYRKFSDHESLVVTHAVNAGSGVAGVRWYEIRNPGTTASIYQQGTYSPDATYRWMSSAAMDKNGDIAVGYSASSSTVYPSIRYTGRLSTDALGTLPQGEATLLAGTGFQSGVNRWGDYSAMGVDPTDDCTFWYTQEYNNSSGWSWRTQIGSFKFAGCTGAPPPTPTNTPQAGPTNTPTRTPVSQPTNTPTPRPTNTPVPQPTNTPPPGTCSEKLTNGGFEGGRPPWVETSSGGYEIIDTTRPHTGTHSAYLAGYNNGTDTIYQQVTIPSTATSATLTYWWNVSTQEACCRAYDYLYARVLNSSGGVLTTLQTLSNASPNNVWRKSSFNLLAYKGQTIRIYFKGTNDVSLPTSFFIDDVSLNTCP